MSLGPIAAAVVAAVDLGRCGPAVMVAKCLAQVAGVRVRVGASSP